MWHCELSTFAPTPAIGLQQTYLHLSQYMSKGNNSHIEYQSNVFNIAVTCSKTYTKLIVKINSHFSIVCLGQMLYHIVHCLVQTVDSS